MHPLIQQLSGRKLVGMKIKTNRLSFQPYLLWSKFMPKKMYINQTVDNLLYSVQVYDYEKDPKVLPNTVFDQWAAVEVSGFESIPEELETHELAGGLYAKFIHKGKAADFPKTIDYIYNIWLPVSEYKIDTREHFEILGEKYQPNSSDSEEEIWVPIQPCES